MDKIERQRQHFNKVAAEYYTARKDKNHLRYKKMLFRYIFGRDLGIDKMKKLAVLEPMCGYGEGRKIIRTYLSRNIQYEGFDYSDVLVNEVKRVHPNMNIYKQDVTVFQPEKDKYDIIILIGGLHHVPDYAGEICRNISTGLKKDGLFINFEPTNNNPLMTFVRKQIYKKNHLFDEETERAFSLKELNGIYKHAGMTIEKQFFPGLLGYIMYYNPDAFPFLNRGDIRTVDRIFRLEHSLYTTFIGKWFSFCTFSITRKAQDSNYQ